MVKLLGFLNVLVDVVVCQVLGQHHLAEDIGVQVGGGLVAQQLLPQRLIAAADPADAHARSHDLGEGAQHAALLAQLRAEAGAGLALEAQLAVRVVLQHQQIAVLEDFCRPVMNGLGVGQAGGVLEVGDDVDQLGFGVLLHSLFQQLAVNAVAVDGDGQHLGVKHMERLQCHQIGGVLHDDLVACIDHGSANHGQGLLGAVGDDDVIGGHAVNAHGLIALGNPLPQHGIAGGRAVLQGDGALFGQHLFGGCFHLRNGEGYGVGQTAGKGYDVRGSGSSKDAGSEFALEIRLGYQSGHFEIHGRTPFDHDRSIRDMLRY